MRKYLFLIILFTSTSVAFGQSLEFSAQVNSGLSWFGGGSAASRSFIIVSDVANSANYTNHPYGKMPGVSYGVSAQVQKITSKNWLFGAQAGYEVLRSKLKVNEISSFAARVITITEGQTVLRNTFINTHVFFGRRLHRGNWDIDVTAGPEMGLGQNSHENGFATENNGNKYISNLDRTHLKTDWRARLQVAAYYRKIGLSLGYAHGLSNYQSNLEGANFKTYARITRLGVIYRFN
ncbi:hypothetical protein HUW51_11415 [Adhaeribacter swui]|uniref:PorT family protein n=1 Tax=Adhaeribacter swui TaxID=2086471 RepID=A0A7G7G823_9BACT|nr:hypothetical protein [Adhaeribacter swui]QNF33307.1 hypothetical protein HUW51_11415 [Adhaeribacter swui]